MNGTIDTDQLDGIRQAAAWLGDVFANPAPDSSRSSFVRGSLEGARANFTAPTAEQVRKFVAALVRMIGEQRPLHLGADPLPGVLLTAAAREAGFDLGENEWGWFPNGCRVDFEIDTTSVLRRYLRITCKSGEGIPTEVLWEAS